MIIPKHVIIATGIYPPEIGGPAQYARELFDAFLTQRYDVSVVKFGMLKRFPTGLRHMFYFFKLFGCASDADYIIALDTFSVGFPAVFLGKILGIKVVVRLGGDFLWESYVERTKERVLLSHFYTEKRAFILKERIIFAITRWVLRNASAIVFSTDWQKHIMQEAYCLSAPTLFVIENRYVNFTGEQLSRSEYVSEKKVFLSPSRDRVIKNKTKLEKAWGIILQKYPEVVLDTDVVSHEVLEQKIADAYAVVVPSLSEVSPNIVLDALSYGVPALVTSDTGIAEKIKDTSVFFDPMSVESLVSGIEKMLDPIEYEKMKNAIKEKEWNHSYDKIAQEFIDVYQKI